MCVCVCVIQPACEYSDAHMSPITTFDRRVFSATCTTIRFSRTPSPLNSFSFHIYINLYIPFNWSAHARLERARALSSEPCESIQACVRGSPPLCSASSVHSTLVSELRSESSRASVQPSVRSSDKRVTNIFTNFLSHFPSTTIQGFVCLCVCIPFSSACAPHLQLELCFGIPYNRNGQTADSRHNGFASRHQGACQHQAKSS